jgi:hypothetical protein
MAYIPVPESRKYIWPAKPPATEPGSRCHGDLVREAAAAEGRIGAATGGTETGTGQAFRTALIEPYAVRKARKAGLLAEKVKAPEIGSPEWYARRRQEDKRAGPKKLAARRKARRHKAKAAGLPQEAGKPITAVTKAKAVPTAWVVPGRRGAVVGTMGATEASDAWKRPSTPAERQARYEARLAGRPVPYVDGRKLTRAQRAAIRAAQAKKATEAAQPAAASGLSAEKATEGPAAGRLTHEARNAGRTTSGYKRIGHLRVMSRLKPRPPAPRTRTRAIMPSQRWAAK